jgi:hypothetical protein
MEPASYASNDVRLLCSVRTPCGGSDGETTVNPISKGVRQSPLTVVIW